MLRAKIRKAWMAYLFEHGTTPLKLTMGLGAYEVLKAESELLADAKIGSLKEFMGMKIKRDSTMRPAEWVINE